MYRRLVAIISSFYITEHWLSLQLCLSFISLSFVFFSFATHYSIFGNTLGTTYRCYLSVMRLRNWNLVISNEENWKIHIFKMLFTFHRSMHSVRSILGAHRHTWFPNTVFDYFIIWMQKRIVFTSIKATIKRGIYFYFAFDSNACARFFPMEICIQMNNYIVSINSQWSNFWNSFHKQAHSRTHSSQNTIKCQLSIAPINIS